MKTQIYHNSSSEENANKCDLSQKLCVNCAGTVCIDYGIDTRQIRHDFYLLYMLKGKMKIQINNSTTNICAGELIIISPQTPYHYTAPPKTEITYLWIHFTGYEASDLLKNLDIQINCPHKIGIRWEVYSAWKKLFHEFILNDALFFHASGSILTEILIEFSRNIHNKNNQIPLLKSISYIHKHYNTDIKIPLLAHIENLSETHYRVLFKKYTALSPVQYIINTRIDAATELLKDSSKSISEIASLVGYPDVYYFGRLFKNRMGISPGRYRRRMQ